MKLNELNSNNNTQHKNKIQDEENSEDLHSDNQEKILNDVNEILNNNSFDEQQPNTFVFNNRRHIGACISRHSN